MKNNEWIEWNGGDCPVPKGTLIDVRYRDGEEKKRVPALGYGPGRDTSPLFWRHDDDPSDIVAYRLADDDQPFIPAAPIVPTTQCMDSILNFYPKQLTLRDQFAMAALTGLLASPTMTNHGSFYEYAKDAYVIADFMIKARDLKP